MSRPAPVELLAALGRAMEERGWRWYVFGAQAVVAHGRPRLTADVDATVEAKGATGDVVVEALERHGFALRFALSVEHLRETRLLPMVHAPSGMPLDLVIAGGGLEQEFLDRARPVDVGGVMAPIVSAEDLVAMKVFAGRRKDLEDVRGVLVEQGPRLDRERVREVLEAMATAVGERTAILRYEKLLRTIDAKKPRSTRTRAKPPTK